jgi:hypothetical protein
MRMYHLVRIQNTFFITTYILCLLFLSACQSSSSDSSDATPLDDEIASSFTARCGLIDNGRFLETPVRAEMVETKVIGSDTVIITRLEGREAGNSQLVKLHGITSQGVSSYSILHGISIMEQHLAEGAYFIAAGNNCEVVLDGGGSGTTGQIFSLSGENMSELMLSHGSALPFADICGGDVLSDCYREIELLDRPLSDIELDVQSVNIPSLCGAVSDGTLVNPVTRAELVRVIPLSSTQVIVSPLLGLNKGEQILVQLQGLTSSGLSTAANRAGLNLISAMSSPEAYFVRASNDCAIELELLGPGTMGQIYSSDGTSINEEVVRRGYALASSEAPCGSELLEACYKEIESEAPPPIVDTPPPPTTQPHSPNTGGEHHEDTGFPFQDGYHENLIRNFLWKPVSESNGRVVVLVNPLNVRVDVQGAVTESLTNFGESNGRGTTARGSRPGCGYGSNVRLTFFNAQGVQIPVASEDGLSVVIPDGCRRLEFRR